MTISNEILTKYNMKPLEKYKEDFGDLADTEYIFYKTFLVQTDHIPAKLFEDYIESMVDGNVNMGSMKKFFNDIKAEHEEVLAARKFAREEINRIEQATE